MRQYFIVGLVLIAAATVAGLLILAIHKAERESQRVSVSSTLKQLSMLIHSVHDQGKRMPPAIGDMFGKHGNVFHHLIPFAESRMGLPELRSRDVLAYLVSAGDSSAPVDFVWQNEYATTNYPINWLALHGGPQKNGKTTFQDSFPDGLQNTILFALRYRMCNGTPTLWAYDKFDPKAPLIGYYNKDKFQIQPSASECDPKVANSWLPHMGVAMADGSVRWISPDVSARTWALALHPADGEPLGKDWDY